MIFQLSPLGTTLLVVELILFWIILFIISLIFIAVFLGVGLNFVKNAENVEFIDVFGTALLIVVIVDFLIAFLSIILAPWIVLIIGFLIGVLIINARHNTGFLNARKQAEAALEQAKLCGEQIKLLTKNRFLDYMLKMNSFYLVYL